MAHFSVNISMVQRSKKQNAVACSAYISRSKLKLNSTNQKTWDYSAKTGLAFSKIYAPKNAPDWVFDREQLWNKAEQAENRHDATTAGKIMFALPKEFSLKENIALSKEIIEALVAKNMIVDSNIHNDNKNNPHNHIQYALRILIENKYGEINFSPIKNRNWQGPAFIKEQREFIANTINKHYVQNGFNIKITEKSYEELGIDLIPSKHEGYIHNIKNPELKKLNHQIAIKNAERIKENPSIILSILKINNLDFTKKQIAIEIQKRLSVYDDTNQINNIKIMQKHNKKTNQLTCYDVCIENRIDKEILPIIHSFDNFNEESIMQNKIAAKEQEVCDVLHDNHKVNNVFTIADLSKKLVSDYEVNEKLQQAIAESHFKLEIIKQRNHLMKEITKEKNIYDIFADLNTNTDHYNELDLLGNTFQLCPSAAAA